MWLLVISYDNIRVSESITLTAEHCRRLHRQEELILEEVPLKLQTKDGIFQGVKVKGKLGENLIKIQIGKVEADGTCAGEALRFHDHLYDRERATLHLNLTLKREVISLKQASNKNWHGLDCKPALGECNFPGRVITWSDRKCRARSLESDLFMKTELELLRQISQDDTNNLKKTCEPLQLCESIVSSNFPKLACINGCAHTTLPPEKCDIMCAGIGIVDPYIFQLGKSIEIPGCNMNLLKTNSPHIFVGLGHQRVLKQTTEDIFTRILKDNEQVNNRKKFGLSISNLAEKVRTQICLLKSANMKRVADLMSIFNMNAIMVKKGKIPIQCGEILTTLQCRPEMASIRSTTDCYKDLPIFFKGKKMFRDSIYFQMKINSTKTNCNEETSSIHNINGKWIALSKNARDVSNRVSFLKSGINMNGLGLTEENKISHSVLDVVNNHNNFMKHMNYLLQNAGEFTKASPSEMAYSLFGNRKWALPTMIFCLTASVGLSGAVLWYCGCAACCCCIGRSKRQTRNPLETNTTSWLNFFPGTGWSNQQRIENMHNKTENYLSNVLIHLNALESNSLHQSAPPVHV